MLPTSKTTLQVMFGVSLVTANIIASKVALVGGYAVPAGFVGIGVAFLCSDILGELHGKQAARDAVNGTILALIVSQLLIVTALWMQPAPFYEATEAYQTVLGGSATIVLASILTFFVSQNLDVTIFHYLKEYTDGKHPWTRNIGSTVVSQFVDTSLFIILGFGVLPRLIGGTVTPWAAILSLIVGQYIVKVGVAVLDTPIFYLVRSVVSE